MDQSQVGSLMQVNGLTEDDVRRATADSRPAPPHLFPLIYMPLILYREELIFDRSRYFVAPQRPDYGNVDSKRFCVQPSEELGWFNVSSRNGITHHTTGEEREQLLVKGRGCRGWPAKTCMFTGLSGFKRVEYAHIVPVSENFMAGLGLWLRVNGIIECNFLQAEKWKLGIHNFIPLINELAGPTKLHRRGTIFLLTFEEACDVVKVAEEHLAGWANREFTDLGFQTWKSSSLMKDWHRKVFNINVGEDGRFGTREDKLYECTLYVVHRDADKVPTDGYYMDIRNEVKELREDRYVRYGVGRLHKPREEWEWVPRFGEAGQFLKILPHEVRVNRTLKGEKRYVEDPMDEDNPKMLLPCEIVSATLIFTRMMKKLFSEGWTPTKNLRKLMEVLDWLLLLAESPYAGWMYEKQGDRPSFRILAPDKSMDTLPGLIVASPNPTVRLSHFNLAVFDNTSAKAFDGCIKDDVSSHQGAQGVKAWGNPAVRAWAGTAFKGWCSRRREDILHKESYWDLEDDGHGGYHHPSSETHCKHEECCAVLDAIQDESIAALAEEAKIFHGWMQNDGLGEALRKLRCEPPQEELFEELKARDDLVVNAIATCECDCADRLKEVGRNEGFMREEESPLIEHANVAEESDNTECNCMWSAART